MKMMYCTTSLRPAVDAQGCLPQDPLLVLLREERDEVSHDQVLVEIRVQHPLGAKSLVHLSARSRPTLLVKHVWPNVVSKARQSRNARDEIEIDAVGSEGARACAHLEEVGPHIAEGQRLERGVVQRGPDVDVCVRLEGEDEVDAFGVGLRHVQHREVIDNNLDPLPSRKPRSAQTGSGLRPEVQLDLD